MFPSNILVTGANGQLGQELRQLETRFGNYRFFFAGRDTLSIDDKDSIESLFQEFQPGYCINCAAYTAVDKAESEKESARKINAFGAGFLAEACKEFSTSFIHISTDYVFDGTSSKPYKESDRTSPVNYYGESKLEGEKLVSAVNPESIIIRTSWVYSEFGNNFVKTMLRLMKERDSLNVVDDQIGSPTYAADLAEAIMKIISSTGGGNAAGIYNYSNEGEISWYEFALAINELSGSNCKVNPISSSQYPTPAKRPQYSLLDKSKIQSQFNLKIPEWKDSLKRCIERLKNSQSPKA